ncbi:MAG: polysulfide reductase NrfD [Acidimicrobiia bacterium]|nr:MAG: polysulfide reductase NrfD [Acidimicrobiia bacterium]
MDRASGRFCHMDTMTNWRERLIAKTTRPTLVTTYKYWLWLGFLIVIVGNGVFQYSKQWQNGLIVTDMRDRISWGLYISAFVFFIGISHAGTLISAILRVSKATWRAPITRVAEFITAVSLVVGAAFVLIDMGRPDRIFNVFRYGRWQSPIMWDVMAITTYLTASVIYLYAPMIPDLGLFRDRLVNKVGAIRNFLYRTLALNWYAAPPQVRFLGKAITIMMLIIMPIAVSVHTVVSWIFSMTLRAGWNTSIFGVLFVAGAIFSGVATLILVMAILRRIYHWEEYLTQKHFLYLGYLLAAFGAFMIYVNINEYLTEGFKIEEAGEFAFRQLFVEDFAVMFWFYIIGGLIGPIVLMLIPKTRTIAGVVVAAILVDIAMFLERYFIVVTGLRVPLMPYEPASYAPTFVEWSIFVAGLALFALLLTVAVKIFPMLAVWEMTEEHERRLAMGLGGEPHPLDDDGALSVATTNDGTGPERVDEGGAS